VKDSTGKLLFPGQPFGAQVFRTSRSRRHEKWLG
jgi:hypothetical protein